MCREIIWMAVGGFVPEAGRYLDESVLRDIIAFGGTRRRVLDAFLETFGRSQEESEVYTHCYVLGRKETISCARRSSSFNEARLHPMSTEPGYE
jgi:hypothetical protein